MKLIFDLETDGLLDDVTKVHCLVTKEIGDGSEGATVQCYYGESINDGVARLKEAEQVIGHNIIGYDLPVLNKLYGLDIPVSKTFDTLVVSRLFHTTLKADDYKKTPKNFPTKLLGSHSLEAWGHRLGEYKGYKPESWEVFTPEMLEYCEQDVKVTEVLYQKFLGSMWEVDRAIRIEGVDSNLNAVTEDLTLNGECILLEHQVAELIHMQEQAGVHFDERKAAELLSELHYEKSKVEAALQKRFKGWFKFEDEFTPKRPDKKRGYTKGGTMSKIKWIDFNPDSRAHLARVLKDKYGWKPKKISNAGNAIMDESVLKGLAKMDGTADMLTYLTLSKRISQLSEGKHGWLKLTTKEGLIHGRVNPMGTITGRMSHFRPNISQVPAVYSPYGKECRELFTVRSPNNFIVGADADGLELRCLAHYLYKYDGGKYARAVLYGNKEEGTDAHSLTLKALGSLCKDRDTAKTFFYALIYGGGDYKLGLILGETKATAARAKGKAARARVERGITGFGLLNSKVQSKVGRGWLKGLDGRRIYIRSEHAALNSLLQSAGAVIMKKALVILNSDLTEDGWIHGEDFWYLINSHDEWQIEVTKEPDIMGNTMCQAMPKAGVHFNLNVPITGEYKIGKTWAETH